MLIAGTTGSGKSVCMNSIIMSFLYTKKPNELKLVLVDPKMVELSPVQGHPAPDVPGRHRDGQGRGDPRVGRHQDGRARTSCSPRPAAATSRLQRAARGRNSRTASAPRRPRKRPRSRASCRYMVFVIDELADLMMTNKEVEHSIVRIAQKARAVGIHLILATQRPQANVVTGLIKSNMPAPHLLQGRQRHGLPHRARPEGRRAAARSGRHAVSLAAELSKLTRAQGTLVDDKEIRRVAKFMREVAEPTFERSSCSSAPARQRRGGRACRGGEDGDATACTTPSRTRSSTRPSRWSLETKRGSVSMLQRRLAIGYTRASPAHRAHGPGRHRRRAQGHRRPRGRS